MPDYPLLPSASGLGRKHHDITGVRFGRLIVLDRCASNGHGGKPRWRCSCDCGNVVDVPGARLRGGSNKSCGCFRRDRAGGLYKTHGKSKTLPYMMFYDARKRAQKHGLPFTIEPSDIRVSQFCPVLGIPMDGSDRNHVPSLDRIIPELGYTPQNICVISFRANRMKGDSSVDELRRIIAYVERGL